MVDDLIVTVFARFLAVRPSDANPHTDEVLVTDMLHYGIDTLVAAGTVGGLALAWAGIRALSGMFFTVASVRASEPVLLVGAPLLLATLALLACYLPARRSTRIAPAIALREE